jgi:hypothetical protein
MTSSKDNTDDLAAHVARLEERITQLEAAAIRPPSPITIDHEGMVSIARQDAAPLRVSAEWLAGILTWLQYRENDLRLLTFRNFPVETRQPMRLENGFYVGRTKDRKLVRVKADRWNEVLESERTKMREIYAVAREERKHAHPVWDRIDEVAGVARVDHSSEIDTETASIEAHLVKCRQVEWWVDRADNLSLGKWVPIP